MLILLFFRELQDGLLVVDENGNKLGQSKTAAKLAISQVIMSRIGMCIPGMSKILFHDYSLDYYKLYFSSTTVSHELSGEEGNSAQISMGWNTASNCYLWFIVRFNQWKTFITFFIILLVLCSQRPCAVHCFRKRAALQFRN